jgi:hypothetical protein
MTATPRVRSPSQKSISKRQALGLTIETLLATADEVIQ